MRCLGFLAASYPSTRTRIAVEAVLAGAASARAETEFIELQQPPFDEALRRLESADAIVFASPIYRASTSWVLKAFLEATPRAENPADNPLRGKACQTLTMTGSGHHFLASDHTRAILSGFFAAQVMSPPLALDPSAFTGAGEFTPEGRELAERHGRALVEFARALQASPTVQELAPLV